MRLGCFKTSYVCNYIKIAVSIYYFHFVFYFLASLLCQVFVKHPQPAITCSKLTIETLEQGLKYVQS